MEGMGSKGGNRRKRVFRRSRRWRGLVMRRREEDEKEVRR